MTNNGADFTKDVKSKNENIKIYVISCNFLCFPSNLPEASNVSTLHQKLKETIRAPQ